ncbi:MAG: helix-turn-helix transcriptional regulator [Anaerolineaceae bacterium]|nr:helix-turn-helix transcriptional regulator [Anaerolineaceae bacterium]
MTNQLREFKPCDYLQKHIDAYWFFRNNTEETINWPVVPDGCSDIIFYLNNSKRLDDLNGPLVTGIMESAQLILVPEKMELFGIRFKPGILFNLLKTDMSKLTNNMFELSQFNNAVCKKIKIDPLAKDKIIVSSIEPQLKEIFQKNNLENNLLKVTKELINNPNSSVSKLSIKYGFSIKNLERGFYKKVGVTPKKFARIMRFQKAHKLIKKEGLNNLVVIALSSGYFDQAHFNREYKKLVGYNPSNETLSILYNK